MKCSFCGGRVEWQGPLVNLTHTKCFGCGRVNCQEVEPTQEDTTPVQSVQDADTDPHEKDESRAGIRPFENCAERRAVDRIL